MIKSIELTNFESHKHSEFVFSPYINIITGQSNHGKSSIIRGLYWIKIINLLVILWYHFGIEIQKDYQKKRLQ